MTWFARIFSVVSRASTVNRSPRCASEAFGAADWEAGGLAAGVVETVLMIVVCPQPAAVAAAAVSSPADRKRRRMRNLGSGPRPGGRDVRSDSYRPSSGGP